MKATAVTKQLEIEQETLILDKGKQDILISLIDPLGPLIESVVDHPAYPPESLSLSLDTLGAGGWVLLRAGQVSTLTLSGLDGWTFDQISLNAEVRSNQIAISPTAGDAHYEEQDYHTFKAYAAVFRFDPPRYVHRILSLDRGTFSGMWYRKGENTTYHVADLENTPLARNFEIRDKVDEIHDWLLHTTFLPGSPRIVVDNMAMGLAISTAEDRLLHRAPQTLTPGQSATTPNLAETLNGIEGDTVTLNLMSQSDCVLFLTGSLLRRRMAQGFTAEVPETLNLSSWQALMLTPEQAAGGPPQTTALSGTVRKTGPERLGLTESGSAGPQILRAHPRLRLVQPFQPFAAPRETPATLSGLWLMLAEPPAREDKLTLQIGTWDPRRSLIGEPLARKTATLVPGLSDYEAGPDGLIAAWIPFEEPWVIDPDQQTLLHAITLSEIGASIPLVEAALAHSQLAPALFRDAGRTGALSERKFAGNRKALLFDLGREEETTELVITSGASSTSIPFGAAARDFSVTLPHGSIVLASRTSIEIEGLSAETTTAAVS